MTEKTSNTMSTTLEKCKIGFYYIFFFSLFVNLLMLTVPLFMMMVFDYVLTSFSGYTLAYLTIIAIFSLIIMASFDIIRGFIIRRTAFWFEDQLNTEALRNSADQLLNGNNYGTQCLQDLNTIRSFLSSPTVFSLFDAPWMPIFIFVIFWIHPLLGILATVGAIMLITLGYINEFISKDLLQKASVNTIFNQRKIDIAMRNAEVIQAMGMMDDIAQGWKLKNDEVSEKQLLATDRSNMISSISKLLRFVLQLGTLALGAYLVIQEKMSPGGMIAASILLGRALAPADQSIAVWKQLISVRQCWQRLKDHFDFVNKRGTGIKLPSPTGIVKVEKIIYTLPNLSEPILNHVEFECYPGEIIALIGPSGAGKTTLARLMAGVISPTEGAVRLDGANVYQWDREDFGKHIGYVPQDIELFPGTIKENIARLKQQIDDAQVIEAAKLIDAHEFILKHPDAYDTEIGGNSNVLSGGQRQRIALARAFYGSPQLILLDEPSSNLDGQGVSALFKALTTLKSQGSTIIIITHHIQTLKIVDRIAILQAGELMRIGPRDDLLRTTNEHQQAHK